LSQTKPVRTDWQLLHPAQSDGALAPARQDTSMAFVVFRRLDHSLAG
jgi:hypothetical protein